MKGAFYPKLAMTSIRNNKRLYIPYILTCIGIIMVYYILCYLTRSSVIASKVAGGSVLQGILNFGSYVIAIFAILFLFYTNSFLTKRRKKEFGLYNILGMNKKNISRILVWETITISIISLGAGLALGILFSKLSELCLLALIGDQVNLNYEISLEGLLYSVIVFLGINLLLLVNNIVQVGKNSAISLVRSENAGEKKLKGNAFLAIVGALILGAAYYIAVTIKNPIQAMTWFFIAVLMVIVASYMLFISGSVFICKMLKKNKKYYYKPNHFVSVSSMAYRMKRHGAGLASICILSTMVLVTISTTFSLYVGTDDTLNCQYPGDYNYYLSMRTDEQMSDEYIAKKRESIQKLLKKEDIQIQHETDLCTGTISAYLLDDGTFESDIRKVDSKIVDMSKVYTITFVPVEEVNQKLEKKLEIQEGEAILFDEDNTYDLNEVKISGVNLKIKERINRLPMEHVKSLDVTSTIVVLVSDMHKELKPLLDLKDKTGTPMLDMGWRYEFDLVDLSPVNEKGMKKVRDAFNREFGEVKDAGRWYVKAEYREDFFNTYTGLFFIGIMLSAVFTVAAALIIYYKQITEGYEDQSRFDIMQKVGMTKKEIRKSINSQLLIVFFLPLVGAACHLCFAFPMINKLLNLFSLYNTGLFAASCGVCFAIFALLYVIIYKMTSNTYFSIVSK